MKAGHCQDAIVTFDQVTFKRGARIITDSMSLAIPRGKITGIMGPSGTGKTTLLQLIGGRLCPDQGEVKVNDAVVHTMSRSELYKMRRKMSILFQNGGLFTSLTVFENVAFPLRAHTNLSESMLRYLVLIKLEMVGLRGTEYFMPSELSGGMARRVALARSLALDPQLMMYDEPFTGQDPITKGVLVKLIKEMHDALGITSVVVSHDIQETASIADYLIILADGHLLGEGEPKTLLNSNNEKIKQFVHGLPDGAVPFRFKAKNYEENLFDES